MHITSYHGRVAVTVLSVGGAEVAVLGLEVVRKRDVTSKQIYRHVSARILVWIA